MCFKNNPSERGNVFKLLRHPWMMQVLQLQIERSLSTKSALDRKRLPGSNKFDFDFRQAPTEGNDEESKDDYYERTSRIPSDVLSRYQSLSSPFANLSKGSYVTVDLKSPINEKQNGDSAAVPVPARTNKKNRQLTTEKLLDNRNRPLIKSHGKL